MAGIAKGMVKPGDSYFAPSLGADGVRHFHDTTILVGGLTPKWRARTDVGGGMFLYNAKPGQELNEEQLAHNRKVMEKVADQINNGIEK